MAATINVLSNLTLNLAVELTLLQMTVGHDGLLRGSEICSGLVVSDFTWSDDYTSVTIKLDRSKCNREGDAELIVLVDSGPHSAVRLLFQWFNKHDLWTKFDFYVFPNLSKNSAVVLNWGSFGKVDSLRRRIKELVSRTGRLGRRFGTHSLRAGGATDLFNAGVPFPIIQKFGRWKSNACLRYYRDVDRVAFGAAKAFKKLRFKANNKNHKATGKRGRV